jgi:L-ascorbate metabolism protein UlaG (beta-lactamase superfamily)
MRRLLRSVGKLVALLLVLLVVSAGALWFIARDAFGGRADGARLARMEQSPQWRDGRFDNRLPRVDGPMLRALGAFAFGGSDHRTPDAPIPFVMRSGADYRTPPASGLRVTWLGHSTLLLELDGRRVLIDPVWGERASPFSFMGPKRFFPPPLPLTELPPIDAVVISHDHYDHLDVPTVKALMQRHVRWLVPLGVGAHLRAWGVAEQEITELDWWQAAEVNGLTITATPARHFSGRGLGDMNRTLWAGWAMAGPVHRVFYSGDTALHDEFTAIGALGPFDLTMIEAGAYSSMWADVHLGPEQAVLAHQLVHGKVMLPVHWGLFDLALHGWTEPIERVLVAAQAAGVPVLSPRPGEMLEPSAAGAQTRWWPQVPWETAAQAPVQSTGVRVRTPPAR